jgi:hypothetical protein
MFYNCVRLEDVNVKFGPNPEDRIAVIVPIASLDATTNVVSTPFAPGTTVLVLPLASATVSAAGDVTLAANPEPSASGAGGFMVIGTAAQTIGGIRD